MSQTNPLLSTEVDIYLTETPFGPVRAIFSSDMDQPGVIFDGAGWPAADFMREVIAKAVGPDGHSYTERSITADIYQDFCQVDGVVIHSPFFDIDEPQGNQDMPILDSVVSVPKPNVDMVALRSDLMDPGQSVVTRIGIAQTLVDAKVGLLSNGSSIKFGLKKSGKMTRTRINNQVAELVKAISSGVRAATSLTVAERELFVQYSGKGGLDDNSQYEYYTPVPVAEGAWDLLKANGFENGNVLEPSTGAGVFSATKPSGVRITGTEIDKIAATVNASLHPEDVILNQSFEELAASAPDNHFDAVIGNVPFGDARGASVQHDPAYKSEKQIERYFIKRVIDKTRYGGLITLVVPTGVVSNQSGIWSAFRAEISRKAEFLGAHKLPSKTFGKQGTDVVTDVIVLRKHSKELIDKIDLIPSDVLSSAKVLWSEFIDGQYFRSEGLKYIHGTYVPADPSKARSAERVIAEDGSTPESMKAKLAQPFHSRIDWDAVDLAEPVINYYATGDRRVMNGLEMEFDGNDWHKVDYRKDGKPISLEKYGAETLDDLQLQVSSPELLLTLNNKQAFAVYKDFPNLLSPQAKMAVEFALSQPTEEFRELAFRGSLIGSLVTRYLAQASSDDGTMQMRVAKLVQREFKNHGHPNSIKGFYLGGEAARYFGSYLHSIDESGNLSDALSQVKTEASGYRSDNLASIVEFLGRSAMDGQLDIDEINALYDGEATLADIADTPGLAVTAAGMVLSENRYCCGKIYTKMAELMLAMESEQDPRIKANFSKSLKLMMDRATYTKIEDISFGLRDRWIPPHYKAAFLDQEGYKASFRVQRDVESDTGEMVLKTVVDNNSEDMTGDWSVGSKRYGKSEYSDFANQLDGYMNGKSIAHNLRDKQGVSAADRAESYREQVQGMEERFEFFMRSQPEFDDIERKFNQIFNNYVAPEYDRSDLGLKNVSAMVKPHWYQNQGVRRLSENGSGILGHDVGLGKTYQGLAFSVYDRQMGRSKKHLIVVPNAVLANWYMESKTFLGNHDDVLFVGFEPKRDRQGNIVTEAVLDENGQPKKNRHTGEVEYQDVLVKDSPEAVYEKMHSIPQSNVGLVVMTAEKYATIPLRPETRLKFAEDWARKAMMTNADLNKESKSYQQAKQLNRNEGHYANDGTKKKEEIPYFEDMGFDRVLVDEAHNFKNSFTVGADAQKLAYLPSPAVSQRGRDMAMKMAWMRETFDGRGPILLTATPVANSPIEIFNMLSLVIGQDEFERLGVFTPDDFVRQFGRIDMVEKVRVSGEVVSTEGLAGFKNLNALRSLFHRYADMKNAHDVDPDGNTLKLPDAKESMTISAMTGVQQDLYDRLREEANKARNPKAIKSGEARPMFAVIRDMDRVTTDIDLYNRTVTFLFKSDDKAKLERLIASLPASVSSTVIDEETGEKYTDSVAKVETFTEKGETLVYVAPEGFEDAVVMGLRNVGIDYVSHPMMPKYASLIENMRKELDQNGKQIIFTEEKSQHGKLFRLIANTLPVDATQIDIINADTASGEKLQQISDAYNRGDTRIIIANKKAEVGVNLQKGTTAIHHLTLPWNPASIQQRNGRGVRQGNRAKEVRVYYYQAEGSFDEYRLDLLKNKGNWMASLMDKANTDDSSDNMAAMGAIEQAALLADNKEEFLKMMAAQREAKEAEKRLKRQQTARIKLIQLTGLRERLGTFDADLQAAKTKAAENVSKAEAALVKARDDGDQEFIDSRVLYLSAVKARADRIDADWAKKRSDMEIQVKQVVGMLKGAASKGDLPFPVELIDNPAEAFMLKTGEFIIAGRTYKLPVTSSGIAPILRVDEVFKDDGLVKVTVISGHAAVSFQSGVKSQASVMKGAVDFPMTPDELELEQMLGKRHSYAELRLISQAAFDQYNGRLKLSGRGLLWREDGSIEFREPKDEEKLIYPAPSDQALLQAMIAAYRLVLRGSLDATIRADLFDSAASAVYGSGWRNTLNAHMTMATDDEITAKAAVILKDEVAKIDTSTEDAISLVILSLSDSGISSFKSRVVGLVRAWLTESEKDNSQRNIEDCVSEACSAIKSLLSEQRSQIRRDKEKAAMDAVRNHPDFKEVPDDIAAAFRAMGVKIFYNTEDITTDGRGRFRNQDIKAFARLFLKDDSGKGGRVFAVKEILKNRFSGNFCGAVCKGDRKYGDSTWHVPSSVDLQELLDLIG